MEGGADADTVQVNGNTSAGDGIVVERNSSRLHFDRAFPDPFSLDIGTTETLTVNGAGGNDNIYVFPLAGVASLTNVNLHGFEGNDTFTTSRILNRWHHRERRHRIGQPQLRRRDARCHGRYHAA